MSFLSSQPYDSSTLKMPPKVGSSGLCKVCGAALPRGVDRCILCGTTRGSTVPLHPKEVEPVNKSPEKQTTALFHRYRTLVARLAFLLALVLLGSSLATTAYEYFAFQALLGTFNTKSAVLYQHEGNQLKLNLANRSTSYPITQRFQSSSATLTAKESSDSRFLGYLNNQRTSLSGGVIGTFYLLDLLHLDDKSTKPKEGIVVTEEQVVDFAFLPKQNNLVYLTGEGTLYFCSYQSLTSLFSEGRMEHSLLDQDVKGLGTVSEDAIFYYKGEDVNSTTYLRNLESDTGSSFALYSQSISNPKAPPTKVSDTVYAVLDCSKSGDQLFFLTRTQSPPTALFQLFLYNAKEEEPLRLVADNVWQVVEASLAQGKALFLSPLQNTLRFEDLLEDDLKQADDALLPPVFSSSSDRDAEGTTSEPEVAREGDSPQEAEQLALEEQQVLYEEKLLRDRYRAFYKSEIRDAKVDNFLSFSLNLYQKTTDETTLLAEPIYNRDNKDSLVVASIADDYAVYVQSQPTDIVKIKLSEIPLATMEEALTQPFAVLPLLGNLLPDTLSYTALSTGETQALYTEPGARFLGEFYLTRDKSALYFINFPSYESPIGSLYQVPFRANVADKAVSVDDVVNKIIGETGNPYPGLLYQSRSLDEPPQINYYSVTPQGIIEVATNVSDSDSAMIVGENNSSLLYFNNFNEYSKTGDLYLFDEKANFISENIAQVLPQGPNYFFLVRREPNSFRSLYIYNKGELQLIDEQLGGFLLFPAE